MSLTEKTPEEVFGVGSGVPIKGSASYDEILQYCNSQFSACRNLRMQFERQWYLNMAFYFGRHYVTWTTDQGTARLITPPAPGWRVRLTSNQVRRYIRKEFAKSTKEKPTGFVLPASGDDSDLMAAKAGDAIIEYTFREANYFRELKRAVFWAHITGTGFLKDWYRKADQNSDSPDDLPIAEHISPWHLFVPDILQVDIEAQEYVIHASSKSKNWVRNTYGAEAEAQGRSNEGMLEQKFLSAMGVSETSEKDQVFIKEFWFKPGSRFKDGAVVVLGGSDILYMQESWPYKHNEFPVTKIDHIPTGRFYSESIITDLIPIQKEYNRTRSQIIEAKNKMAKPQLSYIEGSIDPNKVTSQPGLMIAVRPGFEQPKPIPLVPLPNYVIQEIDRNKADMDDISSQHEVSRGQVPPGIEAATAISYLQEQDDTVLADLVDSIESGTEKIGRHFLHHVNENWDETRKIQVTGLNNQLEAFEFSKANLQGNTDYIVQSGSATPRSQAAKQAFIMDAMKNGFVPVAQGLKYLEMADASRMYEELQIDSRQAQRENLKMQQGMGLPQPQMQIDPMTGQEVEQPIDPATLMTDPNFAGFPTNTWDNHLIHIDEHDKWRKRQEFESADPAVRVLFEKHDRNHKEQLILMYGGMPPNTGDPGIDGILLNSMVFKIKNGIPLDGSPPPVGSSQEQAGG